MLEKGKRVPGTMNEQPSGMTSLALAQPLAVPPISTDLMNTLDWLFQL
jgi:hypothetical protein